MRKPCAVSAKRKRPEHWSWISAEEGEYILKINRLPRGLEPPHPLQSLSLSWCDKLSADLSPLASLTSLQSLDLSRCYKLSGDLSPLAGLISLQWLDLSRYFPFSQTVEPDRSRSMGRASPTPARRRSCARRTSRFVQTPSRAANR